MEPSPYKPLRQLPQQTGLSYGTRRRAVKRNLHFYPYKISVHQEILPSDHGTHIQCFNWFNVNMNDQLSDFSDEVWFFLSGYVNSQNYRHGLQCGCSNGRSLKVFKLIA